MVIETDGEIAFAGNDVTTFIQPAADEADILAVLFLGARSAVA
jgi:hypothetical protein